MDHGTENYQVQPLVAELDQSIKFMFEEYLCGTPNSLVFEDNGQFRSDLRESYQRFLKLNRDSRCHKVVASAVSILEKHNWRLHQDLIRLYKGYGFFTILLKEQLASFSRQVQ